MGSVGLLIVTLWVSVIEWTEPRGVLAVAAIQGNLDQREMARPPVWRQF